MSNVLSDKMLSCQHIIFSDAHLMKNKGDGLYQTFNFDDAKIYKHCVMVYDKENHISLVVVFDDFNKVNEIIDEQDTSINDDIKKLEEIGDVIDTGKRLYIKMW